MSDVLVPFGIILRLNMNISNQSCAIYKLRNIVSTPFSVNTDDKHGDANTIRGDVHVLK